MLIIFALCILCAISFYLYKSKGVSSTLDKDARDFAVKDTSAVTKIFLADKLGNTIKLERKENGWIVNEKYPCRPDAISLLLYTMKTLDVKSPVSKNALNGTLKIMATKSVKVEIYEGNELVKQYYVGHENQTNDGTFMLLTNLSSGENYDAPFVMHIPGFNGFLSSRYFTEESDWRSHLVLNYIPPQIKSIRVEHSENLDSSFVINLKSTTQFELQKINGQPIVFDELKLKQYLAYFQNVSVEKILTTFNKKMSDSLRNVIPFITLSVTDSKNEIKKFHFLHKNSTPELNRKYGIDYKYDPDRFFMKYENDAEIALVQFYVFGKILPTYEYFIPKSPVKK